MSMTKKKKVIALVVVAVVLAVLVVLLWLNPELAEEVQSSVPQWLRFNQSVPQWSGVQEVKPAVQIIQKASSVPQW